MKGVRRKRPSFSPIPMITGQRTPLQIIDNSFGQNRNQKRKRIAQTPLKVVMGPIAFSYPPDVIEYLYSRQIKTDALSEIYQSGITTQMRSKLIEWMITFCKNLNFSRNVMYCAVSLLDRSLFQLRSNEDKFQLLGATCVFISTKMLNTQLLPLRKFVEECANAYTTNDFLQCESDILQVVNYDVSVPTVADFLDIHEATLDSFKSLRNMIWFLADVQLQFSAFLRFKASTISIAIIIYALHCLGEPITQPCLGKLVAYEDWTSLYNCIEELARVIMGLVGKTKTSVLEKTMPDEYRRLKHLIGVPSLPPIQDYLKLFPNVDLE